jgi:hypothetical protein
MRFLERVTFFLGTAHQMAISSHNDANGAADVVLVNVLLAVTSNECGTATTNVGDKIVRRSSHSETNVLNRDPNILMKLPIHTTTRRGVLVLFLPCSRFTSSQQPPTGRLTD